METPQFALRPSAAGLWVVCGGYARMAAKHPELPNDNEVREEGTAAHWLAYETGNNRPHAIGTKAPNGIEIDEEMQDGVAEYLAFLNGLGIPIYLEHTVAIPSIHKQCGGTIDAWGWDAVNRILYVTDLKYGYKPVDPYENWQLLSYVRGALDYLQATMGQFTEHFKVVMTIVQPRGYGHDTIKQWRTTSDRLIPYMYKLKEAARVAIDGTGECTAGPHCFDCSANADCKTLQTASLQLIDVSTDQGSLELAPHQASAELRRLDRAIATMQARQAGLESQMTHAIGQGHIDQHFAMNNGRGKLAWREGVQTEVLSMARLYGKDLSKPQVLITPTQAKGKLPPELLDQYTEHRPGKLKLRRLNDNHADKMFNTER